MDEERRRRWSWTTWQRATPWPWSRWKRRLGRSPANDNCFWTALLGSDPMGFADEVRCLRRSYAMDPFLLDEDRERLLEGCDIFLELFHEVCVTGNPKRAERLAWRLNQWIPELMVGCPVPSLRPDGKQLAQWTRNRHD